MPLQIVLVEILAILALAIGSLAMSHAVFWLLERLAAWDRRQQERPAGGQAAGPRQV